MRFELSSLYLLCFTDQILLYDTIITDDNKLIGIARSAKGRLNHSHGVKCLFDDDEEEEEARFHRFEPLIVIIYILAITYLSIQ